MFEQALLTNPARTCRVWTVLASFLLQIAGLGVLVLIPLIATDKLPVARLTEALFAPSLPPVGGPAKPESVQVIAAERLETATKPKPFTAPAEVPREIAIIVDPPQQQTSAAPGPAGPYIPGLPAELGANTSAAQLMAQIIRTAPPPAAERPRIVAAQPAQPKPVEQLRVGGDVQEAKLTHKVIPVYPRLAVVARISGTVTLSAIIGADGRIRELRAVSGHPILIPAALEAVRQWTYSPTLLNGAPVEVITTIDVKFRFGL